MTRFRILGLLTAMALCAAPAFAQNNPANMSLTRSVSGTIAAGETIYVTVTLNATPSEDILALGVYETIPTGTSYQAVTSSNGPSVKPTSAGATGTLGFAWIDVPTFPYSFTYSLLVDSNFVSPSNITGYAEYRLSGSPLFSPTTTTTLTSSTPEEPKTAMCGCSANDGPNASLLGDTLFISLLGLALFAARFLQPRLAAEKLRTHLRR